MNQKIDIGGTVEQVFAIYRDQAGVLLPAAAAVFLVEAIVGALLIEIGPGLLLVAIAFQFAVSTLYAGMVVSLVSDVQDGRRDQSVGELFRSVTPVLLPLIGASILAGIGIFVGFLLLVVPGLFLITIWAVLAPVIVVERSRALSAFGRSRQLVRGDGWQVFGVIVILFLIAIVVSFILGAIGAAVGTAGRVVLDFLGSVLTAPLVALAASVLYFQLRRVKGEAPVPTGAPGVTTAASGAGDELRSPEQPAAGPAAERPAGEPAPGRPAEPAPERPAGPEPPRPPAP